ncbi:MAG: DUF1566 domain-containing protein [Candidatus Electrothrix sp. AU1_5]|nr:DUF1566 domain-containing protein [Candidatus Electrothrix gigas]
MPDEIQKPSFWETLPGVITAIATLIGAVAALITALYSAKIIGQDEPGKATENTGTAQVEEGEKDSAARRGKLSQQDKTIGQYIDHGNGTVTDTKTGLMWKRCSEGLSGENCEEGKAERYKFDEAVEKSKSVKYAGYADWRLPTIDEFRTLVYCSNGTSQQDAWDKGCNDSSFNGFEKPTINQQVFPNTREWDYWSGSPYANLSDLTWYVNFNYGYSYANFRNNDLAVRLVRNGQ